MNSRRNTNGPEERPENRPEPKPGRFRQGFAKLRFAFIGFIVGIAVGVLVLPALISGIAGQSDEGTGLSPSIVFSRIQDRGELVTASVDYTIVDKVTKSNRDWLNLFDVPFTENSFWYRYAGTIKAGVDLKSAQIEQDADDPTVLHVTLNEPYIISNTPDMESTGVLEENNNLWNPISVEQSDAFQAECVKRSQEEAIEGGLLEEAKANAEDEIVRLFTVAFGEGAYTIDFTWVEA